MSDENVANSLYVQQGQKQKKQLNLLTIMGVGGGACNILNSMVTSYNNSDSDKFVFFGTDQQSVDRSLIRKKIQLGEGMGAGADHMVGAQLAQDNIDLINMVIQDNQANVIFVIICAGGGTGSGAGPVLIEAIKNTTDSIVVAVVTTPFTCEGSARAKVAADCINQVKNLADAYILIENDRVFDIMDRNRLFTKAFDRINSWLANNIFALQETVESPSFMNIDPRDLHTILKNGQNSFMFSLVSENEKINDNLAKAFEYPLCASNKIKKWKAKNALIFTQGNKLTTHVIHDILTFIDKNFLKKGDDSGKIIVGYNPNHNYCSIRRSWIHDLKLENYIDISNEQNHEDDILLVPTEELEHVFNSYEKNGNQYNSNQLNNSSSPYMSDLDKNATSYRFSNIHNTNTIITKSHPPLSQIKQSGWLKVFIILSGVEPVDETAEYTEKICNQSSITQPEIQHDETAGVLMKDYNKNKPTVLNSTIY